MATSVPSRSCRALVWERNNESGPASVPRMNANVAVEQPDEALRYSEPQPCTTVLARLAFVELREGLEDALAVPRRNAWAGIGYGEYERVVRCRDVEIDRPRGRELHRVSKEVDQDLTHLTRIGRERRGGIRDLRREREPARFRQRRDDSVELVDERVHLAHFGTDRLPPAFEACER